MVDWNWKQNHNYKKVPIPKKYLWCGRFSCWAGRNCRWGTTQKKNFCYCYGLYYPHIHNICNM